jgi:hypothetical protein
MLPLVGRNYPDVDTQLFSFVTQRRHEIPGLTDDFCVEVRQRLTFGLGHVDHRRRLEHVGTLRPLLWRRLVVLAVSVLVIRRRIPAVRTLLRDDRRLDPDRLLAFLNVPIELLLPRPVSGNLRRLGTLELDEK